MILTFGKLIGLVLVGYLLFREEGIRKRFLPLFTALIIKGLIPLYMITRYGSNWNEAVSYGAHWIPIFFLLGGVTILFQYILVRGLFGCTRWFNRVERGHRNDFILLFTIHNAGYIPLPIFESLVPNVVLVYMFAYILAFHLIFWSAAFRIITATPKEKPKLRIRLNPPLVGILLGLILASTGLYQAAPALLTRPLEQVSSFALNGILVVLGGILAGVPHSSLRENREFLNFVLIRQIIFPAAVLVVVVGLRLLLKGPALFPTGPIRIEETWRWLQLVLVIQAAVPPATNIMIAVQQFGTAEQLRYTGSGIIISYLGAAVTLPLFLLLAVFV